MTQRIWSGPAGLGLAGAAAVTLTATALTATTSGASAECLRRIVNRSGLVLVASQDGGPPATLLPGRSLPVRLARPGRIELSAYCGIAGAAPTAQATFEYEAVLDRCFVRFGSDLYEGQIGRGFFGTHGSAPFTVNAPRPGDVTLGPVTSGSMAAPACPAPGPVLSRRG